MKILVVGESARDIFKYGTANRLDPAAPAIIFNSVSSTENGGMAKNVANNLLSLHADVTLHTNENWQEITKTRFVDRKTNYILLREDVNDDKYGRCDIKSINFSQYDAVILSDYNKSFLTEDDIKTIALASKLSFLDTKKPVGKWAECVSFIKINNDEFKKAGSISKKLKDKLIITVGPEGCIHKGITYPVPSVEIKDLAGCGDTFLSGLVVMYLKTQDIGKAIQFANECATEVCQRKGVSVI